MPWISVFSPREYWGIYILKKRHSCPLTNDPQQVGPYKVPNAIVLKANDLSRRLGHWCILFVFLSVRSRRPRINWMIDMLYFLPFDRLTTSPQRLGQSYFKFSIVLSAINSVYWATIREFCSNQWFSFYSPMPASTGVLMVNTHCFFAPKWLLHDDCGVLIPNHVVLSANSCPTTAGAKHILKPSNQSISPLWKVCISH